MASEGEMRFTAETLQTARQDIRLRTLNNIGTPFERLIYLASLRDYRSGKYCHDGLAMRFSDSVAAAALCLEHVDAFHQVASSSLESLVQQLGQFLAGVDGEWAGSLKTWHTLEPYRVIVPGVACGLSTRVFFLNIRFALAILATHPRSTP